MQDLSESNLVKNCPHCDPLSFALKYPLFETKNFRVVCDVHPLTEGHILIIPKKHLSCIGEFNQELLKEFNTLYAKFSKFLSNVYGKISAFEHGKTGQTIFHCHVHLLPFQGKISAILPEGLQYLIQLNNFEELKDIYLRDKGYLFLSFNGNLYLVDTKLSQPRFFRDRFAKALGNSQRGNWKEMSKNTQLMLSVSEEISNVISHWQQYS